MKNHWKALLIFGFLTLLLTGTATQTIFAAENKIHKNDKHQYEFTLPSSWVVAAQKNSEVYFAPEKDVVVIVYWETIPRSDSYGTYLLDEMDQSEKELFQNEVESSFKSSMDSLHFMQSEYVEMRNGHQAFVLAANDKNGPLAATILIRGNQTFFIIGKADSAELFDLNKDVIGIIMDSFKLH
jgi:hypothetical protein